jgi:hypothetical protein
MKLRSYIFYFALLFGSSALAQEGTSLWTNLSVKKKINKKFSATVSGTARFPENISYLQTYFFEGGLGYKITSFLSVEAYYRNISRKKNSTSTFNNRQRYYVDLSLDKKVSDIKLENRVRYQHQFKDNEGLNEFQSSYFRDKIGLSYVKSKKWRPSVSADFFFNIQDKQIDQIRPKLNLEYALNKNNSIEVGLLKNVGLNGNTSSGWILNLAYGFKF